MEVEVITPGVSNSPRPNQVLVLTSPEGITVGENLNPSLTFEGTFKTPEEALVAISFKLVANHRSEKDKDRREELSQIVRQKAEEYTELVLVYSLKKCQGSLTFLKDFIVLAFHIRDIREGKGERDLFHYIFRDLLRRIDPITCRELLKILPEYGYYKDLLRVAEYGYSDIREIVIQIFAEQLLRDGEAMKRNEPVTLCAKFAPRDRKKGPYIGLSKPIAKKMGELAKVYSSQFKAYRKVVAGLSTHIDVIEQKMSGNTWSKIDPKKVPSMCLKINRRNFLYENKKGEKRTDPAPEEREKCRETFLEHTKKALKGEAKMSGRTLQPHEFVIELWDKDVPEGQLDILEAQWMDLRKAVKDSGKLGKYCVVSDVSGSMAGTPMMVAIGLGILISEVVSHPFADKVMCFSAKPHWYDLSSCDTFAGKVNYLQEASNNGDWGQNTDFEKVIELMITTAKSEKAGTTGELPEYLLVLSDMQFDVATSGRAVNPWELTYERIERKVKESGFDRVPTIVFWNLRGDTHDFPAKATTKGVLMLSGFSPMILKYLMNEDDVTQIANSYVMLMKTLNTPRYHKVRDALQDLRLLPTPRPREVKPVADHCDEMDEDVASGSGLKRQDDVEMEEQA